jgi:hypothetical protein
VIGRSCGERLQPFIAGALLDVAALDRLQLAGNDHRDLKVALGPFLRMSPEVITLGVRPCLEDYSKEEKELIRRAQRIFFPTPRYVDLFKAMGKPTFPSYFTYRYQSSRILQQFLFHYLNYPSPRTRIYTGDRQKGRILEEFSLPVVVMGSSPLPYTTYQVCHRESLNEHLSRHRRIIVQEAIDWDERIRLVYTHYVCIGAWRLSKESDFICPVPIDLDSHLLKEPIHLSGQLVRRVQLDDVLIEWGRTDRTWMILGMTRPPVRWERPDGLFHRHQYVAELIRCGLL